MNTKTRDPAATARLFGVVVRKLRLRKKWSADTLAVRSGFLPQRIHAIEAGRGQPNLTLIVHLAKTFGVRPSRLVRPFDRRKRKSR